MRTCDQPGCPGTEGELRLLPRDTLRVDTPGSVCQACHLRVIVPTGEWRLRWGNLLLLTVNVRFKRQLAREYLDYRRLRADALRQGWLNTARAVTDYLAVLRRQWRAAT